MSSTLGPEWHISKSGYDIITENSTVNDKHKILNVALNTDLREICTPVLAKELSKEKISQLVLQIQKIRNISAPKAKEESQAAPRLLKLSLTDGDTYVQALELSQIQSISRNGTPPGTKVLISDAKILSGYLLLTPQNCKLLGGQVPNLIEKWDLAKSVQRNQRANTGDDGPPPWVNFGTKIQNSAQDSSFKSLGIKKQDASKENSEFELQRKGAIAEAASGATRKVFGGRVKQNVQPAAISQPKHTERRDFNKNRSKGPLKERDIEERLQKPSDKVSLFAFLEDKLPVTETQPTKYTNSAENYFNTSKNNDFRKPSNHHLGGSNNYYVQNRPGNYNTRGQDSWQSGISQNKQQDWNISSISQNKEQDWPSSISQNKQQDRLSSGTGPNKRQDWQNVTGQNKQQDRQSSGTSQHKQQDWPSGTGQNKQQDRQNSTSQSKQQDRQNGGTSQNQQQDWPSGISQNKQRDWQSGASQNKPQDWQSSGTGQNKHQDWQGSTSQNKHQDWQGATSQNKQQEPRQNYGSKPQNNNNYQRQGQNYNQKFPDKQFDKPRQEQSSTVPLKSQQGFVKQPEKEKAATLLQNGYAPHRDALPNVSNKIEVSEVAHQLDKISLNSQFASRSLRQHLNLGPPRKSEEPAIKARGNNLHPWNVGEECLAKYWEDGKLYNADIVAVTDKTIAVKFKGYGNIEEILRSDCMPIPQNNNQNYQNRRNDNNRPYSGSMEFRRSTRNYN